MGRYVIESEQSKQNKQNKFAFLLYSTQELDPGNIIMTTKKPIWRFDSFYNRQSRQEIDKPKEERFDYNKRLFMKGSDGSIYDNNVSVAGRVSLGMIDNMRDNFLQTIKKRYANNSLIENPPLPLPHREGIIIA